MELNYDGQKNSSLKDNPLLKIEYTFKNPITILKSKILNIIFIH